MHFNKKEADSNFAGGKKTSRIHSFKKTAMQRCSLTQSQVREAAASGNGKYSLIFHFMC